MEFLATPRMLALALMTPLLYFHADLMGVLGGLIVSVVKLDISVMGHIVTMTRARSPSTISGAISFRVSSSGSWRPFPAAPGECLVKNVFVIAR